MGRCSSVSVFSIDFFWISWHQLCFRFFFEFALNRTLRSTLGMGNPSICGLLYFVYYIHFTFRVNLSLKFLLSPNYRLRPKISEKWSRFRLNINVNVIYIAHRRKNNAYNVLNVPSTVQKETPSVYDENSQFACPAQAHCFRTSSMSLVQRQRRCDGRIGIELKLWFAGRFAETKLRTERSLNPKI